MPADAASCFGWDTSRSAPHALSEAGFYASGCCERRESLIPGGAASHLISGRLSFFSIRGDGNVFAVSVYPALPRFVLSFYCNSLNGKLLFSVPEGVVTWI